MKHYLNSDQTAKLIELGFEKPKSIIYASAYQEEEEADPDVEYEYAYSIGELIDFLPKQIEDEYEVPKSFQLNACLDSWEVYYSDYTEIDYYKNCVELIDAIFDMVVELKEKGVI